MEDITHEIPHYVKQLVEETQQLIGMPFRLGVAHRDVGLPRFVPAKPGDPCHRLEVPPLLLHHQIHQIMIAALMLQRQWRAGVRKGTPGPLYVRKRLPDEDAAQLSNPLIKFTQQQRLEAEARACENVVDYLSSPIPMTEVERIIRARWPQHRPLQRAFLMELQKALCHVEPRLLSTTTGTPLQYELQQLGIAYLEANLKIIDVELPAILHARQDEKLVEQLRTCFQPTAVESTWNDDRRRTDEIATILNLRDWYAWPSSRTPAK